MRVPLEKYPGMNRFVLDWLGGDSRFLPRQQGAIARVDRHSRRTPDAALVAALDASNRHWGIFAGERLAAWGRGETLTIIAGQQVGFAGGPLYTLAKIATLVRMKRDLERQGTAVTAFFWLATEDHDFDEAATLNVPVATLPPEKQKNHQLDLLCMRAMRATDPRTAVGSLEVPEPLIEELLTLFDLQRPEWLRKGITFRDSFAQLIAATFGDEVLLVDALLPELRRAGASLFDQIAARHDDIQRALHERSEELAGAGYREQVVARDGSEYTLLFDLDDRDRRNATTTVREAERTSTSALTRPLLQDFVLQPDVFVGGPAEVAYYAQIAPLHRLLGIELPRIALRGHVLVAPRRVERTMERYGIDPSEVFSSADALVQAREPAAIARIEKLKDEAKRDLLRKIEQIGELALPADHSLARSFQRTVGHLEYHFEKLSERAVRGLARKERQRYDALREVVATLYPDRHVQDRVVSWFAWWCSFGDRLVASVVDEIEPDSAYFRIVSL